MPAIELTICGPDTGRIVSRPYAALSSPLILLEALLASLVQ